MKIMMNLAVHLLLILTTTAYSKDITTSLQLPKVQEVNDNPIQDSTTTVNPARVVKPTKEPSQRSGLGFGSDFWNSNWFDSSFGYSTLHSTINCSEPNNPSTAFNIGVIGTGYPTAAITAELNLRPNFAQFLVQEIPGPIVVPADPIFDAANRTCPGAAFNVFSFNSATRGACWVVQGFQDPLFTVACQQGDCVGCSSHSTKSSHVGTSIITKNRCIPQYKSISVWAYCPLIGFPAIVRDQVIVPSFCSCVQTPCTVTTSSSSW